MAAFGMCCALLLAAPWAWGRLAVAGEGERPGAYEVPAECPPREAWVEGVRARLAPLLRTHPALDMLSVRVERDDAEPRGYTGTLGSPEPRALASPRRLHGSSCEEVLEALTFIAALGLQRLASDAPPASSAPRDPAPAAAPGDARGDRDQGPVRNRAGSRAQLGALAFVLVDDGLAPGNAVGLGAAFRLSWLTPSWQPLFVLGAYSRGAREVAVGSGRVRLEHWSTHAVGCPWRFPRESSVGLRPCFEIDVGRSTGKGSGVADAAERSAPWLSAGAQVRVEVGLWQRLELAAFFGLVKPLWHAHFLLEPGVTAFETPAIGLRAGSSASLLF